MKRYNPWREDPASWAELVSWLCVRLAPGERAVSSQWRVERTGADSWRYGRPDGWPTGIHLGEGTEPIHKPDVAESLVAHARRLDESEDE